MARIDSGSIILVLIIILIFLLTLIGMLTRCNKELTDFLNETEINISESL